MKLVVAMMQHETNTFSPLATDLAAFGHAIGFECPPSGAAVIETFRGTDLPIGAFIDLAEQVDAELVVPIAAYAEPGGLVADPTFERISEAICDAVASGCDAVLLDLHGAMVTASFDDAEGELLRRVRALDSTVPIGVALDFHANLTPAMVANATVISGYRTYPHTDMYETGERCARIVLGLFEGRAVPRMVWGRLPIISSMLRHSPSWEPMRTPMDMAIAADHHPRVLDASIFGGFPLADTPHVSLSAIVVTDDDPLAGQRLRDQMLEAAWRNRAGFVHQPEPLPITIERAKRIGSGPVVIADYGDNSGAGGQMDDMSVTSEVLRQGLIDVAVGPIWDPEALAILQNAGVGSRVTVAIGGKTDSPSIGIRGEPLEMTGTVRAVSDGRFRLEGEMMAGFPVNLGGTAVLDTGALEIIVSGARAETYAAQYFTHVGIDPLRKRYLVIKSRQHFRAAFEPVATAILMAAGRGVCSENFATLPFRRLARPIYPLDPQCKPDTEWVAGDTRVTGASAPTTARP